MNKEIREWIEHALMTSKVIEKWERENFAEHRVYAAFEGFKVAANIPSRAESLTISCINLYNIVAKLLIEEHELTKLDGEIIETHDRTIL